MYNRKRADKMLFIAVTTFLNQENVGIDHLKDALLFGISMCVVLHILYAYTDRHCIPASSQSYTHKHTA